ncbi:DNA polymerase subunit gamma-1-like isoform X2 [Tubulanus polymorphus]|uniref:DNA polymerase subunit gamma-1-like isoform X2 n=1 Tax=Tubulanus polymorphus TaxID=672921 RepID=UPI003DA218F2
MHKSIKHFTKITAAKNIFSRPAVAAGVRWNSNNDGGLKPENINEVYIQMLSSSLHRQVFDRTRQIDDASPKNNGRSKDLREIFEHLKKCGLNPTTDRTTVPDVDFKLPPLKHRDIDRHFRSLATQQTETVRKLLDDVMNGELPARPDSWTFAAGWTKYEDGIARSIPAPDSDALVFDVEVLMPEGNFPTMATAVGPDAWYSWCSSRVIKDQFKWNKQPSLSDLIPLETDVNSSKPLTGAWREKLIIGHNVSFDRSFIKEQYFIKGPKTRFLDTMSMHIAVGGFTGSQRVVYAKEKKENNGNGRDVQSLWMENGSMNNLNDVYQLYCDAEPLDKITRDVFIDGTMADVRERFQELMNYCANDVIATRAVLVKLWPQFQRRLPHPVTFAGMLEIGSAYLPVNYNWTRYIANSNATYEDLEHEMKTALMTLADDSCRMMNDKQYENDIWMHDMNWEKKTLKLKKEVKKTKAKIKEEALMDKKVKVIKSDPTLLGYPPDDENIETENTETSSERINKILRTADRLPKVVTHMPGYPAWYRDLCYKMSDPEWAPGPSKISTRVRVTPKLLRLTWDGYPLYYDPNLKLGWGYVVPGKKEKDWHQLPEEIRNEMELDFPLKELYAFCQDRLDRILETNDINEMSQHAVDDMIKKFDRFSLMVIGEDVIQEFWRKMEKMKTNKKPMQLERSSVKDTTAPSFHDGTPWIVKGLKGCWFFKIPHKDGGDKNVGNPLSKDYMNKVEDRTLQACSGPYADRVLQLGKMCSYWKNNMERIEGQMTLWLKKKDMPPAVINNSDYDEDGQYGAIIPRVISAGTITRRAVEPTWLTASNAYTDRVGSELKAMVQCPPGYHFVGADVDSQELWIAAILGDAHFKGVHGCTAFGWMTLQGKKSSGTDLHSKIASTLGISRDHAKIFNYSRIYGAGQRFAKQLLMRFNHKMTPFEAEKKAKLLYKTTKGNRIAGKKIAAWKDGIESATFNMLETIATSEEPTTPVLGCKISKALKPDVVFDNFMTSRVNWVVQSSAVDYLHLMLVCMRWLFEEYDIDGRFCISIHDEVRYLVKSGDRYRAAMALQITNLLTRCLFAKKLGMNDLPQSVAFFSAVDIDTCLRKEVHLTCQTPSNPHGLERGYAIPPGPSFTT